MNHIFVFLFILLQACTPAKTLGVAAPEINDSWIQILVRGIARIETEAIDNVFSESADLEDSKTFELERTLSIGAPNARTVGKGLAMDEKGFIYITGNTDEGVYNAAAAGIQDIILGKYDSQMNPIWTKQIGNANTTLSVNDIAVDTSDNVYITGNTNRNYPGALTGIEDMFLIKLDSNGNQIWSRQKGMANHGIFSNKMTLDSAGNIYIVGHTDGPFGGPLTGSNGFIIKFKNNGDEDWVRQIGVDGANSSPAGIAFDKTTNNVYITGTGNANYETNTLPSIGIRDTFIFKYDSNGNGRFFAQLGSTDKFFNDVSITVDSFGNILIGGSSNGRFETTLGGTNKLGTIAKYDSRGTLQWIRQFGPTSSLAKRTTINSIITDKSGNIFTTGSTNGNIADGGDDSLGDSDAFLTKHNSSGENKWIERIGSPEATTSGNGIVKDREGNLYTIGDTTRGINGAPRQGNTDIFIVKYK
ncbi:SBBP repeat beta-propeller lipoprotein, LipL53 family [Leptospira borgpetersenii]|uniref:SBBP repeat beta-propeller lipoprotein, LipL53 family n=1 Tax=Leptospira borgpetersenii TaxID=174 RepID=UPI00188D4C05|nr:SBBP repeat-containing protein [Leptospira borgpetersenii]MBF3377407.1 SBBP repeat-containing protein [Leptospira borgpetersenii serovar Balcanica]